MASLFEKLAGNLLDLGFRNKLLNFKDSKLRSIEIIEPDSDELLEMINSGSSLTFLKAFEENEDANLLPTVRNNYFQNTQRSSNQIIAYKKGEKYEHILKSLKRFNDSAINEKGINVLYISIGMLNWKEVNYSTIQIKSPLLLIPVYLEYDKSDRSFYLSKTDEDIVVNPTLKAKLELDFGLLLPEFINDEDTVESYLSKVENILPESDWLVDNKTYLGIFSFAKITMYYDLKEHEDEMSEANLVKSIFNGETGVVDSYFDTNYDEYFKKGEDVNLHNVVDADSSQIEAILESKLGKSFVIQGPPGTGKSQTITNIIAELLNDGKKVLFVSEKKAALDVVHNNLKKVGLGDFCFQVHSDKMNKKEFVTELYRVFNNANKDSISRDEKLKELISKKNALDKYCNALSKNVAPLNLTVSQIINNVYKYQKYEYLTFKIDDIKSKDLNYLARCKDALDKLSTLEGTNNYNDFAWFGFNSEKYTYENDSSILEDIKYLRDYIQNMASLAENINKLVNISLLSFTSLFNFVEKHKGLIELPYFDHALLDNEKRIELKSALEKIYDTQKSMSSYKEQLNSVFTDGILDIKYEDYEQRFLNNYRSPLRVFNSLYKSDRNDLLKYLSNPNNKPSYKDLCIGLKAASNYNQIALKINKQIEEFKNLTNYHYDIRNYESTSGIIDKLNVFCAKNFNHSFDIDPTVNLEELVTNIFNLLASFDSDKISKFDDLQSFFFTDHINLRDDDLKEIINKLDKYLNNPNQLVDWVRYSSIYLPAEKLGLSTFISYALNNNVDKGALADAYSYCFYRGWMMTVYYETEELRYFRRNVQDLTVKQFKQLDKELLELDRKEIACSIKNKLYRYIMDANRNKYSTSSIHTNAINEIETLKREANKKRSIKPIRVMFRSIPNLLYRIKPCLLMSPLSVATYLKYSKNEFDVVIFDEASQIFPWDAIGSISRSKSTIIVGDTKQMPPTNFFMAETNSFDDYEDEEEGDDVTDFESILDLATAVLPQKMLNWHYRSKTESLIAFSNKYFYQNRLTTFPSSQKDTNDFGISFHYVKDGRFINRQNVKEAERVIELIYEHFRKHPDRSLGVVCFSISQQQLLEDMIDEKRRRSDAYAKFFDQNIKEPFFVKNLETVQGDERDTIIFSIGYGKDASGNIKHNFGPLNRKGGERRLNVAITRAKYNVQVVSSIRAIDIDLNRTRAEGAELLRNYLDLAENGLQVLNKDLAINPDNQPESPFEEDVANVIKEAGYDVNLQVGCSGYRIDICVKHPKNNDYILAIECDGRSYHSSKNARDRDRLRQEVLERLGWKFYRIWSTDWFINRENEKKMLIERIDKAVTEYDISMKEIEERNKAIAEERYQEAESSQIKISTKESAKTNENAQDRFTETLEPEEANLVEQFNKKLKESKYQFVFNEREYSFLYKLQSDVDRGKKRSWFWILKYDRKLIFKKKKDPDDETATTQFVLSEDSLPTIINSLMQECAQKESDSTNDRKAYSSSNNDYQDENEEIVKNDRFYFLIAKALQGRRVYCRNIEESKLVNEVLEYVMNEISHDPINKGLYKNREDFDLNKYSRRYTYSFYGVTFTLGNISIAKAEDIYYYFICAKVAEKIQEYENMFRKKMIDDLRGFINSLYKLIKSGDVVIEKCVGINSNMSLVPSATLIELIESYLKIIN